MVKSLQKKASTRVSSLDSKKGLYEILFSFLVLLLFSYDRNLLVTHYLLGRENVFKGTILFMGIVLVGIVATVLKQKYLFIKPEHKKVIYSALLLSTYFGVHEIIFEDGLTSAKYSIYLLIIVLGLGLRVNLFFIFKWLGYFGAIVGIVIITQQIILIADVKGDLTKFPVAISGNEWGRWGGCDYVNPYGMGLLERYVVSANPSILGMEINRGLFYFTEPKYFSSILLVTLAALIFSDTPPLIKRALISVHLFLIVIIVMSYSAIFILIGSYIMSRLRQLNAYYYTIAIFAMPLFFLPYVWTEVVNVVGGFGFAHNRLISASDDIGTVYFAQWTLLGHGFGDYSQHIKLFREETGLLNHLMMTYGIVGAFLIGFTLFNIVKYLFQYIKNKQSESDKIFGMLILINSYVVFNLYFFSDIFNMYSLFIILSLIFMPEFFLRTYCMRNNASRARSRMGRI